MAILGQLNSIRHFKGFSLIELLISISIIGLLAAMSISAYPKFSLQLQASTESYKLLAWLRETQVYGISAFTKPGERQVYGVKFDKTSNSIKRIVVPIDDLGLEQFGPGSKFTNSKFDENVKDFEGEESNFVFKSSFKIVSLCDDGLDCSATTSPFTSAYIAYRRPSPEARIILKQGEVLTPSISENSDKGSVSMLNIYIASKEQVEIRKKLVILRTGQMYVEEW